MSLVLGEDGSVVWAIIVFWLLVVLGGVFFDALPGVVQVAGVVAIGVVLVGGLVVFVLGQRGAARATDQAEGILDEDY